MTNAWTDIKNTDLVIVMGGNAAEAHPCGFKWVTEAKHHRGARLIVVDPRFQPDGFSRRCLCPDPPRLGHCLPDGRDPILRRKRQSAVGLCGRTIPTPPIWCATSSAGLTAFINGYNEEKRDYDRAAWEYQLNDDGTVKADPTLADPRCVWNLLKQHVAVYTPEFVENICGTPKDRYLKICEMIGATSARDKVMTSLYALGWTQHSKGAQNIRGMAMLQLILGNVGLPGGGVNALRGHSNIQGLTDIGLLSNSLPGYMNMATEQEKDYATYMSTRGNKPLVPGQTSYWQNTSKFMVSFLKAMWGSAATKENDWGFDWLPKLDVPYYDILRMFDMMSRGEVNILFLPGLQSALILPQPGEVDGGPVETEAARHHRSA